MEYAETSEMQSYRRTGRCPRCDRRILRVPPGLPAGLTGLQQPVFRFSFTERNALLPIGAPVTYQPPGSLRCGHCGGSWAVRRSSFRQIVFGTRVVQGVAPTTAAPRTPPRPPDAEQLRFGGVVESPRRDVFVRTDRKIARNNSSATVTDTEEFSWTVSRSVTVEHQRAAVHGTTATLTLPVLLSLGQTLQRELRSTYALATEATLTRTKTVSVEIPPHSSIELELTWKIVRQPGFGRFTDTGGLKVDLPYEVDMEIELDWRTNDIAGPS